jgi:hypothetical protein
MVRNRGAQSDAADEEEPSGEDDAAGEQEEGSTDA